MSEPSRFGWTIAAPLAGARRGDPAAFAQLVRAIRPLVYRWACVDSGDRDDAEDITQEVLVRLHGRLSTYREGASFTTWLYRITRNVGLDRRRTSERRRRLSALRVSPDLPGVASSPEEEVVREESRAILDAFLRHLPQRQRQAIDLVDMQGYSPAEAAEMLEVDAATVRVHLHRARRRLRSLILERLPEVAQEA